LQRQYEQVVATVLPSVVQITNAGGARLGSCLLMPRGDNRHQRTRCWFSPKTCGSGCQAGSKTLAAAGPWCVRSGRPGRDPGAGASAGNACGPAHLLGRSRRGAGGGDRARHGVNPLGFDRHGDRTGSCRRPAGPCPRAKASSAVLISAIQTSAPIKPRGTAGGRASSALSGAGSIGIPNPRGQRTRKWAAPR